MRKYLLDTHILIWALLDSPLLSKTARALFSSSGNQFFFSAASIWEIALKHGKHPSDIPCTPVEAKLFAEESGFRALSVTPAHAMGVCSLPDIHGDPFDRLLISQARSESMTLVSHDENVVRYGADILAV